jgi:hypothetical protein
MSIFERVNLIEYLTPPNDRWEEKKLKYMFLAFFIGIPLGFLSILVFSVVSYFITGLLTGHRLFFIVPFIVFILLIIGWISSAFIVGENYSRRWRNKEIAEERIIKSVITLSLLSGLIASFLITIGIIPGYFFFH